MKNEIIPVMITVTSSARNEDGEKEAVMRLMMRGELESRSDGWLLRYEETLEDEGDHTCVTHDMRLLLKEKHVTILRKGPYGMMMVLDKGKRYEGIYHTPYGDMPMAVYPNHVRCSLSAERGTAEFEYQLDLQGGFASERRMKVEYAALGDKPC